MQPASVPIPNRRLPVSPNLLKTTVTRTEIYQHHPVAVPCDESSLNFLEILEQDDIEAAARRKENTFDPWKSKDEWGFTSKLLQMSGSLNDKDELLDTNLVGLSYWHSINNP
jgi:hypothetical protein